MRFAVIPSFPGRKPTLAPLIEVLQKVCTVVLVHTEPGHEPIAGTIPVNSFGLSIQQWWNDGLNVCDGATLVLNDDIVVTVEAVTALFEALETADVVYVAGHRVGHRTPLTGWCYGIWPDRIRPDNAFRWWAGDDDLYLTALDRGLTVTALDLPDIEHTRSAAAFDNPAHAVMVDADMKLLAERWG